MGADPISAHRRRILLLATLPMLGLGVWTVRLPAAYAGLSATQWHTLLEFASMLVCSAVTAIAWNGRELATPRSIHVLGVACTGALALDLAHTLSFPGMADLITPNTPDKAIALSMAGPQDGTDVQTLLRHADIAMYRAKAAGRDGFALFGALDSAPAEARLNLEMELRTAIDQNQLVLHYQPRVDVVTGRPLGMEALVRWQHPQRGLLAPAHFIDIAEETGLIVAMGAWVLRHAGETLQRLQHGGASGLTMSVNVSARQFKNPRLVDEVAEMIALSGCAAHQIELELTESAVMEHPEMAEATMRRLKMLGVRLAMDDFGTGYSSLASLKRFPVDCVKIDRSFVNDIPGDAGDSALTRAIIAMGHSLGLHVVAEGVERRDQLDFLRREGCDEYRGYWFAKPMPDAALAVLLTNLPRTALAVAH